MTTADKATKIAKDYGYDMAVREKDWNGYTVYTGGYSDDMIVMPRTGLPLLILAKGRGVRVATGTETMEWLGIA